MVNSINNKVFTLSEIGRNEEAFSVLEKATLTNPNNEYLSSTIAFILYNLGKIDDAKTIL